jgi:hypothetical protein
MNAVAEELVQAVTRRFRAGQFVIEPNDGDPEADSDSVVVKFSHPRRPGHQLSIVQRGNTFEVEYRDGSPSGPAEKLFIFRDVTELSGAIVEVLEFADRIFSGEIVAYRQRLGRVSRWLRRDNQPSLLWFGSRQDVAKLPAGSLDGAYDWSI